MNCFFLYIQCAISFSALVSCTWGSHIDPNDSQEQVEYVQRKWITQLMDEAKQKFDFDSTVNEKCQRDFRLYQQHLQKQSIWAVRMLESSEWPSVGLYAGMSYSMGNWDECLRVSQYDVKGQYCLVEATYDFTLNNDTDVKYTWPDEKASIWNALETYKKMPWLTDRQNFHWALCIPASCKPSEIALSLNRTLYPIFEDQGMSVKVNVDPKLCSRKHEHRPFSQGFYIFCGFAAILILLVVTATIWHGEVQGLADCELSKSTDVPSIVESFSVFYNFKLLTKRSTESPRIHLWKITYMILCVAAHRILINFAYPKFNMEGRELALFRKDDFGFGLRFLFIVDVFCIYSGFFSFHYGSSKIKPFGFLYIILGIVRRWIRMVPVFAIVILCVIHVLPHLSSGPFWDYRINDEVESCKATFWYFFFGVNNIFETNKLCLLTSWYVSVDLQTAIIGDILLYLISRKKSLGIIATIALFLFSTVTCSIIVYINGYHAILQANERNFINIREWDEFVNFYIKTYNRLPLFLLGFITAVLMHNTKLLRDYKVTDNVIFLWTILCILLKTSIMIYVEQFFDFVEPYDKLKHALNALVPRFIFFIPDCWLLIICFRSTGKEIAVKYFDLHIFTILGRLMYCFYAVHILLLMYHATSNQTLIPTTNLSTSWTVGADVYYTFQVSLWVYLFIAAPLSNLESIVLQKVLRKRNSDANKKPINAVNETNFPDINKFGNGKSANLNQAR